MDKGKEVRLMAATDLHYLSESLYDKDCEIFAKLLATNDGKLFEEGKAILQTLKEKALEEKPDALLLAGDLTFNGEMISLEELREAFGEIEEAGIPVYVISGNHDINYPYAASYMGSAAVSVPQISPQEFAEVMAPFGFEEALYRDPSSLSYMAEITEDLRLLVLDANVPEQPGSILSETLAWAQGLLSEAQEKGIRVIVMSHQNVMIQSTKMYRGYVINNHEALEHLLRNYGVQLCLSGHSHLEHKAEADGLTDICMESLAVYPLQYSIITLAAGGQDYTYEKRKLGILEEEAYERFGETVLRMIAGPVEKATDDPEEQKAMKDYAVAMNASYYSGNYGRIYELADDPARKLWRDKAGDSFWNSYLESVFTEID